jgi:hypothetical protein
VGDGLAGEATADKIDSWEVRSPVIRHPQVFGAGKDSLTLSYIAVSNSVGEVSGEDSSTPFIDLYLPDDLHARPFQAQV